MEQFSDRLRGTVYGQAIGDALGLGTEFMDDGEMAWKYPNGIAYYSDIFQDRHRRRWKIGNWTDDTDMMLCIAKAIIKDKGVNLNTIARNFKDWACGEPMGIGQNTYNVLMMGDYVEKPLEASKLVYALSGCRSAANGGVMRTSIVGLLPDNIEKNAAAICRLTHYDPRCVGSCVIVSEIIHAHVYEEAELTFEQILEIGNRYDERIEEYVRLALNGDIRDLELQDEDTMGYTLKALGAGLWAYWHAESFQEGLLDIVRAGGDADTNAAVACAILGAKFGFNAIPKEYVDGLIYREQLEDVVSGMMELTE
ncbi:MAG: ADP-ribosylglycohydrolase family protein [Bacteroidaceae bacterium]|nr:ADP-ribosylglycohydrolase family protein [Bacteroidaceae bacterium]